MLKTGFDALLVFMVFILFQKAVTSSFESQCSAIAYKSLLLNGVCLVKEGPGKQNDAKNGCQQLGQGKLMTEYSPDQLATILPSLVQEQTSFAYPLSPNMAIGDSIVIKAKILDDPSTSGITYQPVTLKIRKINDDTAVDYMASFRLATDVKFLSNDYDTALGSVLTKTQPLTAGNTYTFEIRAEEKSYDLYIDGQRFHQHPYRFTQGTHAEEFYAYGVFDQVYSIARGKIKALNQREPLPSNFTQGSGNKLVVKGRTNEIVNGKGAITVDIGRVDVDVWILHAEMWFDSWNYILLNDKNETNWGLNIQPAHSITANQKFTLEFYAISNRYDIYLDGNLLHQWAIRVTNYVPNILNIRGPSTLTQTSVISPNNYYKSNCLRVSLEASKRTSDGPSTDGWVWDSKLLKDRGECNSLYSA